MPAQGIDGPEGDIAPVKIANISFAFDNAKIIHWLKERGSYIANENWAKLDKINDVIKNALKNDQTLLDKM